MVQRGCITAILSCVLVMASSCGGEDDAVSVPWSAAEAILGGRVLRIGYVSNPCTQARLARIKEDPHTVTVALTDTEYDPQQVCSLVAMGYCAKVRLPSPLAGRRIIDGSKRHKFQQTSEGSDRVPSSRFGSCRSVSVID